MKLQASANRNGSAREFSTSNTLFRIATFIYAIVEAVVIAVVVYLWLL